MPRVLESRAAMKHAEEAFVEAARDRAGGAPNNARYQERLESLIAAYECVQLADPRLS